MKTSKIVIGILAAILLISVTPAYAESADMPSKWAQKKLMEAIAENLVPERLQSDYQKPITRDEFAELLVRTYFMHIKDLDTAGGHNLDFDYWTPEEVLSKVTMDVEFEDAKQDYVKLAFIIGAINGITDTTFAPNRLITRQEAAVMIVNAYHLHIPNSYPGEEKLGLSDFKQIPLWAKPAVEIAKSHGFMDGVGGRFDFKSNITREQAIMMMRKVFDKNYAGVILRGNIDIFEYMDDLHFRVGKDYVKVVYEGDKDPDNWSELENHLMGAWLEDSLTMDEEYETGKAIIINCFNWQLMAKDYTGISKATIAGKPSKWDYGYMTVSTYNDDSLLEFKFKPIIGYSYVGAGYEYGYPPVPVEVKQIK
ncbi:S-layer homology domain-containing protein [Cohnella cholangitidis]|uniref:S-layer homology domain-containing protein n=1 Tax=Cohnella cholangitidis TaxID=2598458 RepID=UPI0015FBE91F|nr:S-layer homology domain-containing protein [Cohnella cholangitidis]